MLVEADYQKKKNMEIILVILSVDLWGSIVAYSEEEHS